MSSAPPLSPAAVSEPALLASLWSGIAISLTFLVARTWIRLKVFRRLQFDDVFVLIAFLAAVGHAAVWTTISNEVYFSLDLANGRITQIPPDFLKRLERLFHGTLAAYPLAYTSLWSVKLSFIVFFRKFGDKLKSQRIAWWAVLGFCLASYFVCIGTLDYRCLTSKGMDMISICNDSRTASFDYVTLRVTVSLDIVTDFSIIFLMTNVLWHVQLRLWTKLALGGIFSLTLFVIVVAIIRIMIAPHNKQLDMTWLVLWQGVELTVALIVVSLASFRQLYTSAQKSTSQDVRKPYNTGSDVIGSPCTGSSKAGWIELSDESKTVSGTMHSSP